MNFVPWRKADADKRKDVLSLLIIHGGCATLVLWVYSFYAPEALGNNFGPLPYPAEIILTISQSILNNLLYIILPAGLGLLWCDVVIYFRLKERSKKTLSAVWFTGITSALLAALGYFLYGMYIVIVSAE